MAEFVQSSNETNPVAGQSNAPSVPEAVDLTQDLSNQSSPEQNTLIQQAQSQAISQIPFEQKTSEVIPQKQQDPAQQPKLQQILQSQVPLVSSISQQKQQSSSKNVKQPKEPTSQVKQQAKKKDKQTKTVQITVKMYKKYVKLQTDHDSLKKQVETIKQQYNKVAKDLISTQEQSQKKSAQIKQNLNELKSAQQKISQLQSQLKLKGQKVQKLEQDYANVSKKVKQQQKTSQRLTSLEQTIKELQKMLDGSTKNEQLYLREAEKYKEMLRIEKQMNSNLKSEVEQLRHLSSQHFSLKQQVGRLLLQLKSLRDAKQQYPIMVQKYQHSQQINQKLKESIRELETKNQQSKTMIQKLQKKIDKVTEEKKSIEKKIASILAQKEERQGEIEAFKMELEDQRTEIEVQRKRYTSEIKDLKLALHHEHEKLKLTQIQLEQSKKKQKKTVNLDGVKFSSLSKEDLFNLIEELEMKNASIKLNLNTLLEDLTLKDLKIKDMQANLMSLTRHIVKALPNLDQSEGMEYVEKEIIEAGKGTKADWAEIVEKVLVQNLRLKNSVTALGQEFNMRLRTQTDKNNK